MPKKAMSAMTDLGNDTTVAMVKKFIDRCPEYAKIKIIVHTGDRFSSDTYSIKATWSEEL